jgi:hypothetical protein
MSFTLLLGNPELAVVNEIHSGWAKQRLIEKSKEERMNKFFMMLRFTKLKQG